MSFFKEIRQILDCGDRDKKFAEFKYFYESFKSGAPVISDGEILPLQTPSYADFCEVVSMKELGERKLKAGEKEKAFLHSIAHIEYSAIDIALDAVYRFRGMPRDYYADWLEVAEDEIRHFKAIESYMLNFGVKYGDYPVHNGLFIALQNTSDSLLERMAVLPRYMEANGLDANAFMLKKLKKDPSKESLREILRVILDEEISHVNKGDRWFKFECERFGLSPSIYIQTVQKIYPKAFLQDRELNVEARLKSGFTQEELTLIRNLSKAKT